LSSEWTDLQDTTRYGSAGLGCPGMFKVTSRSWWKCCHATRPILSPVHASIAVLTVKPSLGILRMQTRGGALLSIAKGPGPRNPHPGPMSCGPPVPNLVESTSSPRVSPNLTGPPSKPQPTPSQHQPTTANNTSQQHQPLRTPPVRISERLSTTDSLRPPPIRPPYCTVRRTSLLQGFARSTSH
jgi:hypothetical protein